jgi:hypothetical protein
MYKGVGIMANFIVSYDLIKAKNYPRLIKKLESMGATKLLFSVWTLQSTLSSLQILNLLRAEMDADDKLLVVRYDQWSYFDGSKVEYSKP